MHFKVNNDSKFINTGSTTLIKKKLKCFHTGLVSLRELDLSYNRIEKLDNKTHGLLDDCLSLEKVIKNLFGWYLLKKKKLRNFYDIFR